MAALLIDELVKEINKLPTGKQASLNMAWMIYSSMYEHGYTPKQVAQKLGINSDYLVSILAVVEIDNKLFEPYSEGRKTTGLPAFSAIMELAKIYKRIVQSNNSKEKIEKFDKTIQHLIDGKIVEKNKMAIAIAELKTEIDNVDGEVIQQQINDARTSGIIEGEANASARFEVEKLKYKEEIEKGIIATLQEGKDLDKGYSVKTTFTDIFSIGMSKKITNGDIKLQNFLEKFLLAQFDFYYSHDYIKSKEYIERKKLKGNGKDIIDDDIITEVLEDIIKKRKMKSKLQKDKDNLIVKVKKRILGKVNK